MTNLHTVGTISGCNVYIEVDSNPSNPYTYISGLDVCDDKDWDQFNLLQLQELIASLIIAERELNQ